jgi:hypothetical protein
MVNAAANDNRVPPPPFWRTAYFIKAMARPDRRDIDPAHVKRALEQPTYRSAQPDGRHRHWIWVPSRHRWLRVIIEADGETVHNAFFDRNFKP